MSLIRFATCLVPLLTAAAAIAQEKATDQPPLISRNRIELHLAGAETIITTARQKAAEMDLLINIAVVDDGGHLLAFARMDGARPASGNTALAKAQSAATFRTETGPRPATGEPNLVLSLALPATAIAGGGKGTALKGGVPIVIDGQVVGAVGIGGGTGEQDAEIAKAAIKSLTDKLEAAK